MGFIKQNINSFIVISFEDVCKEFIKQNKFFIFTKLGSWWGHYREREERKELEIDICALNEKTKEILFAECKWQDKVNAEEILAGLKAKAQYVDWNKRKRREYFAVFAKSFKKKFISKGFYCFDLRDLERRLK